MVARIDRGVEKVQTQNSQEEGNTPCFVDSVLDNPTEIYTSGRQIEQPIKPSASHANPKQSNDHTEYRAQPIPIQNGDPQYGQASQDFDGLTMQKSFQKNIGVDRSLKHVDISGNSSPQDNYQKARSNLAVYPAKVGPNPKSGSPGRNQHYTMPVAEDCDVNPLLNHANAHSQLLDEDDAKETSPMISEMINQAQEGLNSRALSSSFNQQQNATAVTINITAFSHHIGQDSGEQIPQIIQSEVEKSEMYSEIELPL